MKITETMFNNILETKEKVNVINDNYILLCKKMPCVDKNLEDYIASLNRLRDEGVNVCNILDYRLVNGTTKTFGKDISYTTGVFLERRAKGNCISDVENISLRTDKVYDLKLVSSMYDRLMEFYVSELEKRACASQKMYDKLVCDYMSFNKFGLEPDPKPLNFFFDKDEGYSIIDVIPSSNESVDLKYLSRYISIIVFGYGIPNIYINSNNLNIVPKKYKDRLDKAVSLLEEKMIRSLIKVGVSREDLMVALTEVKSKFSTKKVIDIDMTDYIESTFENYKLERSKNL